MREGADGWRVGKENTERKERRKRRVSGVWGTVKYWNRKTEADSKYWVKKS